MADDDKRAASELVVLRADNEWLAKNNDRLRGALEALKHAVDREGWPSGWGLIRKQVEEALLGNGDKIPTTRT